MGLFCWNQWHAASSEMCSVGHNFIQQDNVPAHNSKLCQTIMKRKGQEGSGLAF